MFKYTPRPSILCAWNSAHKPYMIDREYRFIRAMLAEYHMTEYCHYTAFWRRYKTICYYSPDRAKGGIPLDGYMFPIEMFVEGKV